MVPWPGNSIDLTVGEARTQASPHRPWIGVRFNCAGAYVRAYRNPDEYVYVARCPRCGKSLNFRVGVGGTGRRLFEASC